MLTRQAAIFCVCLFAALASPSLAQDNRIYVNNVTGNDNADGRTPTPTNTSGPVKSFYRALHLARQGTHIELANTGKPYAETFQIEGYNLGSADAPLVVEGNGAIVTGLITIPPSAWMRETTDIYSVDIEAFKRLAPLGGMPKSNWLHHWKRKSWWHEPEAPNIFFLNGKTAPHAKSFEEIPQGGFFYNVNQHPQRIYFRLPQNTPLRNCRIELPGNHGVIINDDHVVIRNLASTYSSDDGFSTFLATSTTFHNVYGAYNCDQGLSLHNSTSGLIEGGVFEHNGGCGIADVMNTQSVYIQTTIRKNMVAGMWLAGASHTIQSCYLVDNRGPQAIVCAGTRGYFINTVLRGQDKIDTPQIGLQAQGDARVDHSTISNASVGIDVTGNCYITNSILGTCSDNLLNCQRTQTQLTTSILDPSGTIRIKNTTFQLSPKMQKNAEPLRSLLATCHINSPLPDNCLTGLPDNHPLLHAGDHNTRLGAHITPRTTWQPTKPIKILPVTIFTHGVDRNKY